MISRAIFVGIFLILGGCLGAIVHESRIPDQRDISTSDATVTIFGSGSGVNGLRCYPEIEGQRYRKIIMDAGDASLTVTCRQYNEYGPAVRGDVTFEFVADAGHEYKLIGYVHGCFGCGKSSRLGFDYVDLIDITDKKQVVFRSPFGGSGYFDEVTGEIKAIVVAANGSGSDHCGFFEVTETITATGYDISRRSSRQLTPGPVLFAARCRNVNFRGTTKAIHDAQLAFEAVAGHLYAVELDPRTRKCIRVTDVTRNEQLVTCDPAIRVE